MMADDGPEADYDETSFATPRSVRSFADAWIQMGNPGDNDNNNQQ